MSDNKNEKDQEGLSFLTTMKSVTQSMLGVQSGENAERDFSKGKASHFIIGGIIAGVIFVIGVAVIVSMVTSNLP